MVGHAVVLPAADVDHGRALGPAERELQASGLYQVAPSNGHRSVGSRSEIYKFEKVKGSNTAVVSVFPLKISV